MNCDLATEELKRFREAVAMALGLQFDESRLGMLADVLQRRLDCRGQPCETYLRSLERGATREEARALARELTVGETYFFRNIEQFRALAEVVLPERGKIHAQRPLRVLSAGCASGEEPYSVAMMTEERGFEVSILAVDLNPAVLEKAKRGRYTPWALRETPTETRRRWFQADGRDLILDPALRSTVKFDCANIAEDDSGIWQQGTYDAVFCRNVLMYFSPEQMRAAVARIARSLAPGGFLFLGHAETLRGISEEFHLRHSHGSFYYELKDGDGTIYAVALPTTLKPAGAAPSAPALDAGWFEAIGEATKRIAGLVPDGEAADPTKRPRPEWDPAPALELCRHERFAEALSHVRARPAAKDHDPDVLLLEAALLSHSGDAVAAEDACFRLLLVDEFSAGAHYVLALCREHLGQSQRAIEHDRVATYLNPTFAMPRLHLGLLASRLGEHDTAQRELQQALELLRAEEASRILLFGGGFGREGLMALCQAALKDSEARE
jgi:chemotaxis protein methyltransferase CheR